MSWMSSSSSGSQLESARMAEYYRFHVCNRWSRLCCQAVSLLLILWCHLLLTIAVLSRCVNNYCCCCCSSFLFLKTHITVCVIHNFKFDTRFWSLCTSYTSKRCHHPQGYAMQSVKIMHNLHKLRSDSSGAVSKRGPNPVWLPSSTSRTMARSRASEASWRECNPRKTRTKTFTNRIWCSDCFLFYMNPPKDGYFKSLVVKELNESWCVLWPACIRPQESGWYLM